MRSNIFNSDFQDFIRALNQSGVRYLLVGGFSVILHGYQRSTGDIDIWVERTPENYEAIERAFQTFGMPVFDMTRTSFLENHALDVYTFGREPAAIDVMMAVKGLDFIEAYANAADMEVDGINVNVIHYNDLIKAKTASARFKDLNDLEHLKLHKRT